VAVAVGVGVGDDVDVGLGLAVGVGVGVGAPGTPAHSENSEVSIGLHLPALPALTIAWISDCESRRRKISTSSIWPIQKYLLVGHATAIDPILF